MLKKGYQESDKILLIIDEIAVCIILEEPRGEGQIQSCTKAVSRRSGIDSYVTHQMKDSPRHSLRPRSPPIKIARGSMSQS